MIAKIMVKSKHKHNSSAASVFSRHGVLPARRYGCEPPLPRAVALRMVSKRLTRPFIYFSVLGGFFRLCILYTGFGAGGRRLFG